MTGATYGTGIKVPVGVEHRAVRDHEHLDREAAYAERSRTHLWITIASFKTTVAALESGEPVALDMENLLSVSVGCYVCEAPYEPRLARRACPGEASP